MKWSMGGMYMYVYVCMDVVCMCVYYDVLNRSVLTSLSFLTTYIHTYIYTYIHTRIILENDSAHIAPRVAMKGIPIYSYHILIYS